MPDEPLSFAEASKAMVGALEQANADAPVAPVEATPTPQAPVEATPATETPAAPAVENVPNVPSLDGVDLSGLPEDVAKKIQDGFLRQQDYTKKTQEIAPYRKFIEEAGTDLDQVRKSVEFVNRLENDPDFLRQVAQELQELASDGNDPGSSTEQPLVGNENTGLDPRLVKDIAELRDWKAAQEQERINAAIVADWEEKIQTAENAVRESNPVYDDDDIAEIYNILPAHEFDFFAAQEHYEKLRNRFETRVLGKKLSHPSAANPVSGGTGSTVPKATNSIEDAAAATRERLRQQG